MEENTTLLDFDKRQVPPMPETARGADRPKTKFVKTTPREWTEDEIKYLLKMKEAGYTLAELAKSLGRGETSVSIKLKRLGKTSEKYNEPHRKEKYEANTEFFNLVKPKTVLDAYCGTGAWWSNNTESTIVTTNDVNKEICATYNLPSDKLVAKLYAENSTFDLIDLDPFGSAYDCFDLSIRMAKKAIIVTFGEMGHKRWKRLDFVRSHYGIESMSDFTTKHLIDEFRRIGRRHHKDCVPIIVKEWPRISRVYFQILPIKITEQWE